VFLPQFLFCRSTSRHALKHATLVPIFPWCCSLKNKNAFIFCRWVFCFLAICSIFYPSCRLKCIFSWSVVQKSLPSSIGAKLVAIQLLYRKSSQPVRSNPSNLSSRAHIIRPSPRGSGKRLCLTECTKRRDVCIIPLCFYDCSPWSAASSTTPAADPCIIQLFGSCQLLSGEQPCFDYVDFRYTALL